MWNYTQNERTICRNREMLARRTIYLLIMKSSTSIFIIQSEFYDSRHQCEKENGCLNVSKHLTITSSFVTYVTKFQLRHFSRVNVKCIFSKPIFRVWATARIKLRSRILNGVLAVLLLSWRFCGIFSSSFT